jgi:DNA-directed RNA polymerase subunit RPC12/RpoP
MPEEKRTIGYICPVCGKAVIVERTAFQLAAADNHLACPCGKSELTIRQRGDHCEVTVPCVYCAKDHKVACSNDALLHQKLLALTCSASGLGCCYVGEENDVFQAIEKLEQAVDKLVMDAQAEQRGAFLDEVVMGEVLGEIKEIAARGGISCTCGSKDYGIKVGFSDVDIICAHCGATLRLDAATPDDIDAVCAKYTLTIPGKKED